jgi:hypothetical protein
MVARYELLIRFTDGTHKIVHDVENYGMSVYDCFFFVKNGYRSFVPKANVIFFGRNFDWLGRIG